MRGDDSSIHNISVHASGRYALTSSNSVAQLWDLDTFSRKRTLNGAQTVGIQQVLIANIVLSSWANCHIKLGRNGKPVHLILKDL